MTFRKQVFTVGQVEVIHAVHKVATATSKGLTPAQEPHTKVIDYSSNRLHELSGVPQSQLAEYCGEECIAVIDTETTCETGDNFGKPLIYDIGVTYVRKSDGVPVGKSCYIISDVFCNYELMHGAYFTKRTLTDYPYILAGGIGELVTFGGAIARLSLEFVRYNVKTFAAYNSAFDTKAFDATSEYIDRIYGTNTNVGLVADIRQGTIDVLDLWAGACMTFMSHDEYKLVASKEHWLTTSGNFQTSAEAANNYIHGSLVGEDHTALSDTAIEAGIYRYILTLPDGYETLQHCYNSHGQTWAYVNNLGKASGLEWAKKNGFTPNI